MHAIGMREDPGGNPQRRCLTLGPGHAGNWLLFSCIHGPLWSYKAKKKKILSCPNDNAEKSIERTLNYSCLFEILQRGTKNSGAPRGETDIHATQKTPVKKMWWEIRITIRLR